nr:MerR family transcriptional regulator [Mycobacteroides chelonae]
MRGLGALDEARRVAHLLKNELAAIDPAAAQASVNRLVGEGIEWLVGNRTPLDPDNWYTAIELANEHCVTPQSIRDWVRRNNLRVIHREDGKDVYQAREIDLYLQYRRLRSMRLTHGMVFGEWRKTQLGRR